MLIIFLLFLLVGTLPDHAAATTSSPVVTEPVSQITLVPELGGGWMIDFYPDGSVRAQYGAGAGDEATVPAGTVRFDDLLTAIRERRIDKYVAGGPKSQIAIRHEGEFHIKSFYVNDELFFRHLIDSLQGKWNAGERIQKLLQSHPIYPPTNGLAEYVIDHLDLTSFQIPSVHPMRTESVPSKTMGFPLSV
jgi:hypothetical protein